MCGGMLLVAPDGVALALGSQWLDVTILLQVFAIVAAFDSIGSVLSPVLVVTGRARLLMYVGPSAAVAMPAAYDLGSRWDLVGVAAAYGPGSTTPPAWPRGSGSRCLACVALIGMDWRMDGGRWSRPGTESSAGAGAAGRGCAEAGRAAVVAPSR